jgi:hypothetical protein
VDGCDELEDAMAVTWTQDDIDRLKTAIANGAVMQSMTFADQTFTFRSMAEMLQLLALMQREVAGGSRSRLAATRKGA